MNTAQRKDLTVALSRLVTEMAAELRERLLQPGPERTRAEELRVEEKVGEGYEVWTDLLSRRIAVLWVLKSVYVRVLEDRKLLLPLRLLDAEPRQLFEQLAPSLGETAYLAWIYRDLATPRGGLPELFAPQPAEVLLPSDASSRRLLALWRQSDPDSGLHRFRFDQESFDSRLLGDLYQDLDPVVKARFALLQTPDFVIDYILDLTLTPAIDTFGLDQVRVLDPACGSGHFLLAAFERLVRLTLQRDPRADPETVVKDCLRRVVGLDLNDYACALARARLVMKALELSGKKDIAAASGFHPQVYWTDALEQIELEEQLPLAYEGASKPRALLTRPEVRRELIPVLQRQFHAIVGNPPYITEKDASQRAYHREKPKENTGKEKKPRYLSATGKYSLGAPFTERMFQLLVEGGFMGQITANSFMKREFGKGLIKEVLPRHQLTFVVDTSGAYIPGHGTPTVILFGRRKKQGSNPVPVLMGKRGEPGVPDEPEKGKVWSSILALTPPLSRILNPSPSLPSSAPPEERTQVPPVSPVDISFKLPPLPARERGAGGGEVESEYLSLADVPVTTLNEHPWSIGGGGAAELKSYLDGRDYRVGSITSSIGFLAITGEDEGFVRNLNFWKRSQCEQKFVFLFVEGEAIRDWHIAQISSCFFPYDSDGLKHPKEYPIAARTLWFLRSNLLNRPDFSGKKYQEVGRTWYEYHQVPLEKLRTPLSITFAFKATHNHFVLDRGGKVFKQTAPIIKLPPGSSEDQHLALLGQLNSSVGEFWVKQSCHNCGYSAASGGGRMTAEPWDDFYERDGTKLQSFPLAAIRHPGVESLARQIDGLARERGADSARAMLDDHAAQGATALRQALEARRERDRERLLHMVALQEELDWLGYELYGLLDEDTRALTGRTEGVPPLVPGLRPFEILLAREDAERRAALARGEEPDESPTAWFERHGWHPYPELPDTDRPLDGLRWRPEQRELVRRRMEAIGASRELGLIEQPTYKRRWYQPDHEQEEREALIGWLDDRIEGWAKEQEQPWTIRQAVVALQNDRGVNAVASLLAGQAAFDLEAIFLTRIGDQAVPNNKHHVFKPEGLIKRAAWEETWRQQHEEDRGNKEATPQVPPRYASSDYLKAGYWAHRGKLDVPKERYVAWTEVPSAVLAVHGNPEDPATGVLYGWAGWTPAQRAQVLLELNEQATDAGVSLEERYGLLHGIGFLLPYVAWTESELAGELRTILEEMLGKGGVTEELLARWAEANPAVKKREARPRASRKKDETPALPGVEVAPKAPRKRTRKST
jgi:hypothetical protein